MDKLDIRNEMRQFDTKNRDFYNELTAEEKKKFSAFLMIRWGASVNASKEMEEFYLISANERLNKHFFSLSRHPQLQWLMASSVSPGLGTQRHTYPKHKKKETKGSNSARKVLLEMFPNAKQDEIELMDALISPKELKELLRAHGNQD